MKKPIILTVLLFAMLAITAQTQYSKVLISLDQVSLEQIAQCGIPLDEASIGKNSITVELSQRDLNCLDQAIIPYSVIIDDMSKFYTNRNKQFSSKDILELARNNQNRDYPVPANFELGSVGGFYSHEQILAELDSLHNLFPSLISVKQTIDTFTTHENRPLYWVKISDNPEVNENEPEVLYTGLHHAREGIGMQLLFYYMYYILEHYDTDEEIKAIIDNTELYFIPNINPDGWKYNQTTNPGGGGMWRKNRRVNGGGEYGVDINRNYGYMWGYDNSGSSPDPSSDTYRGPSAFSEPEIQAIKWFCEQHEFKLALNYHSYSNLLIYPWGYIEDFYTADSAYFVQSGNLLTTENGYSYGTANQTVGYIVNGGSDDWFYGEQTTKDKILAYTPEVGGGDDGFWPSIDRIIPLCQENMFANITVAQLAGAYAKLNETSPVLISQINPYITFNISRLGLSEADFSVFISSLDTNVMNTGDTVVFEQLPISEIKCDSIQISLNTFLKIGDSFSFVISLDNGSRIIRDTITKTYGITNVLISDPGNNVNNWTTNQWAATTEEFVSPSYSITDSPNGEYDDDENSSIVLTSPLDLSGSNYVELAYWAKWAIEDGWDYVQVFASDDNGATWTPLETSNTNMGGSNQAQGEPLYDGFSDWVYEQIDITSFASSQTKIKFTLISDGAITEDGFYFDDFTINTIVTGQDHPVILANPLEDISAPSNAPNKNINLSYVFHDPDGDPIAYSIVSNSNPNAVAATLNNNILTLDYVNGIQFNSTLTIMAEANSESVTDEFIVYVGPQGIEHVTPKPISISPNPCQSFIKINQDYEQDLQVRLIDICGKEVLRQKLSADGIVNVASLQSGVYFVKILGNEGIVKITKLIKE